MDEDVAEPGLQLLEFVRVHGCRTIVDGCQRRKVILAGFLELQEPVQNGRHQQGRGDLLGLNVGTELLQIGQVLGQLARTHEKRGQKEQAARVTHRAQVDKPGFRIAIAFREGETKNAVGFPVQDGVHGTLPLARRAPGKPEQKHVPNAIMLHAGLRVRGTLQQIPEEMRPFPFLGRRIHADDFDPPFSQRFIVFVQERKLQ